MRKIIVSEFITLDGVIQAPGGEDEDTDGGFIHGGWTWPYWHDDIGKHFFQSHVSKPTHCCWDERPGKSTAGLSSRCPQAILLGMR